MFSVVQPPPCVRERRTGCVTRAEIAISLCLVDILPQGAVQLLPPLAVTKIRVATISMFTENLPKFLMAAGVFVTCAVNLATREEHSLK